MAKMPSPDDLRTRIRHLFGPPRAELRRPGGPAALSLGYQPIWNVQQKAISIYFGEPIPAEDGASAVDPEHVGRTDCQVLSRVLADIATATERQDMGSVCVPIHGATLANAGPRGELVALCDTIPAELRAQLVWEIVGLPDGIWENALFSVVSTIKPYGRAIFMRRALDQMEFDVPAAVGVHSVGIDLRDVVGSETDCAGRLKAFAESAHALGLRCHVHGLATSSMSLTAIGAGFDYVAGPAIFAGTEVPWGVLPYDTESLFQRDLGAMPIRMAAECR